MSNNLKLEPIGKSGKFRIWNYTVEQMHGPTLTKGGFEIRTSHFKDFDCTSLNVNEILGQRGLWDKTFWPRILRFIIDMANTT